MIGRRPVAAALVAGLLLGSLFGACMKAEPGAPPWQRASERKNEITALWMQIRQWRVEAGLAADPPPAWLPMAQKDPIKKFRAMCPGPAPGACADVCDLADAICDNAESICAIADELAGDDYAEQKCTSAKASCKEAKQRCCGCREDRDAP